MKNKKLALFMSILATISYGQESVNLGKSVIYATTGFATEIRKTTSNPTIITSEDIKNKNYTTVEEALKDIPAVNMIRSGQDFIVDLRGQGYKAKQNVQILVDGVQINSLDTSHTAPPIDTISIDNVERIEILPGGGSVLYGSGTSGGVINIITKKKKRDFLNTGFKYGSYASKKSNIALGKSFGNLDFDLSYTNINRDGYRQDDVLKSDDFVGKINYKITDKQNLTFKYSRYNSDESYPDMIDRKQLQEDRKQSGTKPEDRGKTHTLKNEYTLVYDNNIDNNLDFNITNFYQKTTMKNYTTGKRTSTFEDEKWGVKPKLKYSYGDKSSLILGMDYINNKANRLSFVNIHLKKETISGYLMNNYVWNNFEFNQGIRYERANYDIERKTSTFSKNENNFAYELSTNYLYSDTGRTYLRYEKGFTSPPPALLTNKENGKYTLNNLKSEKYDNFEIGLSDYFGFTSVNTSVFYTLTTDEIATIMQGMPPSVINNYNIGKTERFGFELKTEQTFDKLTLSQGYSYIHAKIKNGKDNNKDISGNYVAKVPEHKLNVSINYAITDKLSVDGDIVYISDVYLNNQNQGGKANSHTVTNIRTKYDFGNGLDIYAGINNLFNKKYYEDIDYSNKYGYTYDPAAERNYYIGFRYNL